MRYSKDIWYNRKSRNQQRILTLDKTLTVIALKNLRNNIELKFQDFAIFLFKKI